MSNFQKPLSTKKNTSFFYGFLPDKSHISFDDGPGDDLEEKIKPSTDSRYVNKNRINTSKIDKFRQGVEITSFLHYILGLVQGQCKIHSGEPGHKMPRLNYGHSNRNYRTNNAFEEIERFDSVNYLNDPNTFFKTYVVSDNPDLETNIFDGVIEPLTIRAVASFSSIEVPFESHSIWGNLESGNSNITRSYDRVLTVQERNSKTAIIPWLDLVDLVGMATKAATPGHFSKEEIYLSPFNDLRSVVELPLMADDDIKNAILESYGDTDNYVPDGYVSATCGWSYDDVTLKGTDSIAFGGFGY